MPEQSEGEPLKNYAVTVEIVDRYWAIQVLEMAASAEDAQASVQAKFDEAVRLQYIDGAFRATAAVAI